jgi:hypothetical protein
MAATPTRKATWTKIVLLCLTICFVPCLRSCGGISFGFPVVAYGGQGHAAHQGQSLVENLRPLNALLDLAVVGLVAVGLVALYRTRRGERARALLRGGLQGLAVYQALVVLGYAVLYPVSMVHDGEDALSAFIIGYAYFIHPYYLTIAKQVGEALPQAWHDSSLFGDAVDLPMRLGYVVMWAAWFGLGALRTVFTRRAAPAPEALGT